MPVILTLKVGRYADVTGIEIFSLYILYACTGCHQQKHGEIQVRNRLIRSLFIQR